MRLIDVEALKEAFRENCGEECAICSYAYTTIDGNNLCQLIDNAPTVETTKVEHKAYNEGFKDGVDQGIKLSERPHGKWTPDKVAFYWVCSECGAEVRSNIAEVYLTEHTLNFCPNCGADMKGGAE